MTPEQKLHRLRQELALQDVLTEAILESAKQLADAELRACYRTLDAAALIRQAALAEGIERLAAYLTKKPTAAQVDLQNSR